MNYCGCWSLVVAGKVTAKNTTFSPTRPGMWVRAVYRCFNGVPGREWIASEILWVKPEFDGNTYPGESERADAEDARAEMEAESERGLLEIERELT